MANEIVEEESIEGLELESENNTVTGDYDEIENRNEDSDEKSKNGDNRFAGLQRKLPAKFRKIIIITAGLFATIIITVIVLYFIGFFDTEPIQTSSKKDIKKELKEEKIVIPEKKKYAFRVKDINKKRLNRKLSLLTKDEIIVEEKIKEVDTKKDITKKKDSVKKIIKDAVDTTAINEKTIQFKKPSLREIKKNKTKDIKPEIENEVNVKIADNDLKKEKKQADQIVSKDLETENEIISEDETKEKNLIVNTKKTKEIHKIKSNKESIESEVLTENEKNRDFLKFAQVATIKRTLYLSYLHKINKIDKRISVCRNDANYIQVFVGPFMTDNERQVTLNQIHKEIAGDAFSVDFTQEEFDKRCKL